ncbi:MAG: T9SS type A sorting domain-containing protein [Ferruginibacter sp.]
MKKNLKNYRQLAKGLLFSGLMAVAVNSNAQRAAVMVDPQLGAISLVNEVGFALNADAIQADDVITIKIPVISDNHGRAIPSGSSKIKIGLGSKLVIDPSFNINNAALSNYFKWTSSVAGGQVQLTGELINDLPASVREVNVAFKVKASKEGRSTITANFLITNHNTLAVLSDENGANNSSALTYRVSSKVGVVPAGEAINLTIYPNPAKDVKVIAIAAEKGSFDGKYAIVMYDVTGKLVQTSAVELKGVSKFDYKLGNIATGKYLIKISKANTDQSYLLKLEKM